MPEMKWDIDGVSVDVDNNLYIEGELKTGYDPDDGTSNEYTITAPASDLRTFDPATATINQLMAFVATLAKDLVG